MSPPSNCQNDNDSNDGRFFFADSTGMLTHDRAEPYHDPNTMVNEGGVPAIFC